MPPFTAIPKVSELLTQTQNIKVGAQNMHWERSGAFTGEISPAMLREFFVRYVVLGHSERRAMFGETDEIVNRKVRAAHEATLRPIVCVGETLAQRETGEVEKVLVDAIARQPGRVEPKELLETVIAYEPVWAIGTGQDRDRRAGAGSARFHSQDARARCPTRRPPTRSGSSTAAA